VQQRLRRVESCELVGLACHSHQEARDLEACEVRDDDARVGRETERRRRVLLVDGIGKPDDARTEYLRDRRRHRRALARVLLIIIAESALLVCELLLLLLWLLRGCSAALARGISSESVESVQLHWCVHLDWIDDWIGLDWIG